jgi:multidrug resistance efflux pump
MKTEPAQIIGWLTGLAAAVIALLVAFGLDMDQTQQAAILGVVAVVAPIIAGLIIRFNVYAPATVERIADKQYEAGVPPTEPQPDVPPPASV